MVKNDNPATAQVLIVDNLFRKPIQGLIAVFKFVDTNATFWTFSNELGIMTITGTKATPLVSGMTNMAMNDTRVNSKVDEIYIMIGDMQQKQLPVTGAILINTTTDEKPTPSFIVAVQFDVYIITGRTVNG
jgi:hypothetical protein